MAYQRRELPQGNMEAERLASQARLSYLNRIQQCDHPPHGGPASQGLIQVTKFLSGVFQKCQLFHQPFFINSCYIGIEAVGECLQHGNLVCLTAAGMSRRPKEKSSTVVLQKLTE
jgi:hypothetical protein